MPRFYYERSQEGRIYRVFDRLRSNTKAVAVCYRHDDAERIIDALNAKP